MRVLRADDKGDGAGGGAASSTTAVGSAGTDASAKADTKTAAAGDTTLAKAGAGEATKTDAKAEVKADAKDTKAAPVEYEKWEPKPVDGIKRPESNVKAFREAGKKFGLSPEQMQGLVDFDDGRTKALADEFRAEKDRTQKGWVEALKNDKELGGSKWPETTADLERAMKLHGDDELRAWLNESGEGDRPALVRFVARIGKSMREDSIVGGTKGAAGGAKKPTLLDQLYGPASAKS